jgi:methyl-accepting chemotaxis protein
MTRKNADNATQTRAMMEEAKVIVEKASSELNHMISAVDEITKTSEEIGKIIKTIDAIAFQTNLLALNAAVEAARAGEAGAGFSVVAEEVRNLAIRAAEAAKSTNTMIENSLKAVKRGGELTRSTQEAFMANKDIAMKIAVLIDEIETASQEQAQGIDQINKAVVEMDTVVQRNAASAEESASASEEMNAQAVQLTHFVRELTEVVGGKQNGAAVEGRSEPLSKKLTGLVHINKKALPVPARGVKATMSVPR